MVLIISQNKYEESTEAVVDWLSYMKVPFYRLNGIDFIKECAIEISKSNFEIKIKDINLENVNVIWFRRWFSIDDFDKLQLKRTLCDNSIDQLILQLNEVLRGEIKALTSFFFGSFPKEKLFNRTEVDEINKLLVLKQARELGINIPNTYVLTKKSELERLNESTDLITKSIDNANAISIDGIKYLCYTASLKNLPKQLRNTFTPSLFQIEIIKKFEIRSFLLKKKFYSMAIFSQESSQTKVDFRKYNFKKPNRTVPYQLPKELEEKLIQLAIYFELGSASFDLIMTKDNEYVFLEVNPGGQFGMVSYPCNYLLEKRIAIELQNF